MKKQINTIKKINKNIIISTFIGLEIHVVLNTKYKLFCKCLNSIECCNYCMGFPGTLPYTNHDAIDKSIQIVKLFNGKINNIFKMDRKHYIYPDLPKKFQITQLSHPIGINGFIKIKLNDIIKKIQINRFSLEEDAARNLSKTEDKQLKLDFNRCGNPLLEITTDHLNMNSADEAVLFLRILKKIIKQKKSGIIINNLPNIKDNYRFDLNLSFLFNNKKFSHRIEIKNINSIKDIYKIIKFEQNRIENLYLNLKFKKQKDETRG